MNITFETVRLLGSSPAHYAMRLAQNRDEIRAAQSLRYQVFNLELKEGLEESHATGLDEDPFDAVCEQLIVEHLPSAGVVGTYRLQTGVNAAAHLGYYCEQEFDFRPFASLREEMLELGHACVHPQHRNLAVLGLLWKGIADYARRHGARHLFGCSPLTSQDTATGASAYAELCRKHLAPPSWRTLPLPRYDCAVDRLAEEAPKLPKLLRAYLGLGAKICGPPALDRRFNTIDFLTWLDLTTIEPSVRRKFLE